MGTNYTDTFIAVAPDCPAAAGEVPQPRGAAKTVALLQYELIADHPYEYTSDDVLFEVFAERNGIGTAERAAAREEFFAKPQACLRASPLGKRYGWGIHHDGDSRVGLVALGSAEYSRLEQDVTLVQLTAMRSRRA